MPSTQCLESRKYSMAGCRWSKVTFVTSLVLVAIVSPGGNASPMVKSPQLDRLTTALHLFNGRANTARRSYYASRISPLNPVVVQNLTRTIRLNGSETAEDVIRRFIQEVDRFRNPVYLAYFDEHTRGNSSPDLSQKLLAVSSILNRTYHYAVRYVFRAMFPRKSSPSENLQWTRVYMENIINAQNISLWPATLHELRTYATLRELKTTQSQLGMLLSQLKKLV